MTSLKVLILGGYGTFGGRLAQLLASDPRVTLLIGGRSVARAQSFCDRLTAGAPRSAVYVDRNADALGQIRAFSPDLVVDATGPFQCYGENPYRIIKACLALGIDYLDLADGAEFVKGVAQFDREARERGLIILSGVSSFPVLSAAVVRRLARGLATLNTITAGIAPSPYAGVGLNVIRAIASYSGKRLALVRGGRPSFGVALTETLRYTISPPGRLPLRNVLFSLVDVPDLQALPQLWPELQSVWVGAGPVPEILHRMLNGLAWLVRLRVLRSLLPLSLLLHQVSNRVRWGEHRGGMFIAVTGIDARGAAAARSWHLLAEGDDGPLIPSMACHAIIERLVGGTRPASGARAATADLELTDYEALFARRTIYTGTRTSDSPGDGDTLYQRVLGDAFSGLPQRLREMHRSRTSLHLATSRADVRRGRNPLGRLVASVIGFPDVGHDVSVEVAFAPEADGERWTRSFAGVRSAASKQPAVESPVICCASVLERLPLIWRWWSMGPN